MKKIVEKSEEYLLSVDANGKDYLILYTFPLYLDYYKGNSVVDYIIYDFGFGSAATTRGIRYQRKGVLIGYQNQLVKFEYKDGKYYWYEKDGDNYEIITPLTDNFFIFYLDFE